jgi:LmbE family N-acetylglucosaminyl deacetylase
MTDSPLSASIKRVLAVGAHPDDIEILCAGTLARYFKMGVAVSIAIATDGTAGHMLIPPKELGPMRRQEASQAASVIGADIYNLYYPDELLFDDHDTRLRFVDLIRQSRPDLILTHAPEDYHPDHRATSRLVFNASFMAGLPNLKTASPAHPGVASLVYFDTLTGANFQAEEYVDITSTLSTKLEMLKCHASQLKWLKDHDNLDALELVETTARLRGFQCNAKYAEAFRLERVWPRQHPYRLLP